MATLERRLQALEAQAHPTAPPIDEFHLVPLVPAGAPDDDTGPVVVIKVDHSAARRRPKISRPLKK